MRHLLTSLIATSTLLSLIACGSPQLPPSALQVQRAPGVRSMSATGRPATNLRIATYNIRNLFDGKPNPGQPIIAADDAETAAGPEQAKPEKELQALSVSMHEINADLIGMQEVESKATLTAFRDRFLKDMGYQEVVLVEGNDERGIDVALFSRYPVLNVKSHKDVRFPVQGQGIQGFNRDLLQVKIQGPNNYTFTVFVAHLKSQHGEAVADAKRRAEAEAANRIIREFQQANPNENVVMMGDFNDTFQTAEIAPLVSPQSGLGFTDIINQDLGAGPEVFSYHPSKYRSRIDYILLNQNMKREYINKSVKLYKPLKDGNTWQKLYFYDASDHIPVTIDLDLSQDK
jgi:endonuclease/exonuclease/phosphatase family metal-dependent hydrolase/predicted small lipoprotein YifL